MTPGFHRLVVKNVTGKNRPGQAMSRCTSSGSGSSQNYDKVHLSDKWGVRMGVWVTRQFVGE